MKIEIEKLESLVAKADEIFLSPDGEKVLIDLLKIKDQVEDAISQAKEKLKEAALRISPDFKSIQGDLIKVNYRAFGSKYFVDPALARDIPAEIVTTTVKYSIKQKELEKWVKGHGGLPVGVGVSDREKQIVFGFKKGEGSEGDDD